MKKFKRHQLQQFGFLHKRHANLHFMQNLLTSMFCSHQCHKQLLTNQFIITVQFGVESRECKVFESKVAW